MNRPIITVEIGWIPEGYEYRGIADDGELLINTFVRETYGGPDCEARIDAIRQELRDGVKKAGGTFVYEYAGVGTPRRRFYPWVAKDDD